MLGRGKNKTLIANPDDRVSNRKQTNQGEKGISFSLRDHHSKSTTTPSQKVKSTKPMLKTNTKVMTDDQQSVTMISEDTDSLDDTETDHTYDHSSDQETIMDILCPDLNSESDSDKDDSLFGTEWLDNLSTCASNERKASHIHH